MTYTFAYAGLGRRKARRSGCLAFIVESASMRSRDTLSFLLATLLMAQRTAMTSILSTTATASTAPPSSPTSMHRPERVEPSGNGGGAKTDGKRAAHPLLHFVGGALGGCAGAVVTCPLEVVKTGLQSSQRAGITQVHHVKSITQRVFDPFVDVFRILHRVYTTESTRGLFKGLGPNLVGVVPARAIHFFAYGNLKQQLTEWNHGKESPLVHLLSGASAGIVTATATNPIWLIKTRMQLPNAREVYPGGSWECLRKVVRNEGARGLYRGLSASYLGAAEGTIQWVIYERLKKVMAERRIRQAPERPVSSQPEWMELFVSAAVAKLVAALITYPHEVIRTRMREAGSNASLSSSQSTGYSMYKYRNIWQTGKTIWLEEGWMALYGGMSAHLLRVVPNAAIMFFCYEAVLHVGKNALKT